MDPWVTHSLTGLFCAALARLPDVWLKGRQQTSDERQTMAVAREKRIADLERSHGEIQAEHMRCIETQGELKGQLAALQARVASLEARSMP